MISLAEYRDLFREDKTPDELVKKRIHYIETFCRNIIKAELEEYVQSTKNRTIPKPDKSIPR
jgi:hypothetical protein